MPVAKYSRCHVHYRCWVARIDEGESARETGEDCWVARIDEGENAAQTDEDQDGVDGEKTRENAEDNKVCGQLVHDTWAEGGGPEQFVACRHRTGTPQHGLGLLVDSMCEGEKVIGYVHSPKAYGAKGSFSFPHVPPHAALWYYIELVGVDPPPEIGEGDAEDSVGGTSRSDMTFEQRVEAADLRRGRGNACFKQGDDEGALREYEIALSYLTDDLMFQVEGHHREYALNVRLPVFGNRAAAYLRMGKHNECIEAATAVLAEAPDNAKALYRRGKARLALGQTEAAEEDLRKAAKASPDDKAIRRALAEVRADRKKTQSAQASAFKGIFDDGEGGARDAAETAAAAAAAAAAPGRTWGQWLGGMLGRRR